MRDIKKIIVHCSATPEGRDVSTTEIKRWHTEERGWSDIGYHWVIRRDGTIEPGRDQTLVGSHARQVNGTSLGICLVGGLGDNNKWENNFTQAQFVSLKALLHKLKVIPIEVNGTSVDS